MRSSRGRYTPYGEMQAYGPEHHWATRACFAQQQALDAPLTCDCGPAQTDVGQADEVLQDREVTEQTRFPARTPRAM